MEEQNFRSVIYLSDVSGTGYWRRIQQVLQMNCIATNTGINVCYSQQPILDQNFYNGINSVTVQRWVSEQQEQIMRDFLKPVLDNQGGWLIYEIDDNMSDKAIPMFNRGRKAFEGDVVQGQIKRMLNMADFVTTTTDYLKERYHEIYDVPYENIISLPNMLSRFWFGDRYDPDKKIEQFKKYKNKPRIGIVSSLSHFNIDNVMMDKTGLACRQEKDPNGNTIWKNEKNDIVPESDLTRITDDFDDITECVRSTVNDFQWVFFGYCPPQLTDLAQQRKIEYHPCTTILNYPSMLENLQLQAIVAPIKKEEFNYSKSFIKTMECAAIGVPLFATNCMPYTRVMKREQLFDTGDELKGMLTKLKFMSTGIYRDIIERQWKWLNSPCHEGDFDMNGYWLDDNLGIWCSMFRLPQKCRQVSMKFVHEQVEQRRHETEGYKVFQGDNGVEIIK